MSGFRRKELRAADWDALVALNDLCLCEEKKEYHGHVKAKSIKISLSRKTHLGIYCCLNPYDLIQHYFEIQCMV